MSGFPIYHERHYAPRPLFGLTALPNDQTGHLPTHWLRARILRQLQTMTACTDKSLQPAQRRNKRCVDQLVKTTVELTPGRYGCVDRATKGTQTFAERMSQEPCMKLLPRISGPFEVPYSTHDTIKFKEEGIPNTAYIDRVTLDPEMANNGKSGMAQLRLRGNQSNESGFSGADEACKTSPAQPNTDTYVEKTPVGVSAEAAKHTKSGIVQLGLYR